MKLEIVETIMSDLMNMENIYKYSLTLDGNELLCSYGTIRRDKTEIYDLMNRKLLNQVERLYNNRKHMNHFVKTHGIEYNVIFERAIQEDIFWKELKIQSRINDLEKDFEG